MTTRREAVVALGRAALVVLAQGVASACSRGNSNRTQGPKGPVKDSAASARSEQRTASDTSRAAGATPLLEKYIYYSEWKVGDCHQRNGMLFFRSDGRARWSCETWTDHTTNRDIWHCHHVIQDKDGFGLFGTSNFDSPDMHTGVHHTWANEFSFPPEKFDAIAKSIQYAEC